ncbi:MAG: Gfo/Idh/MocA family oxidoreductase [Nitrosomonadaceae bacterium]|nr:Gfo/Idh/MocA family oxidoreductase [Nitrosomonadaceae bacterium]
MNASPVSPDPRRKPVRIGIAGYGAAALAFVPAILAHPGFELVAVAEPIESVCDEAAKALAVAAYASVPAMLAGAQLDAIYIGTPTEMHSVHVLGALAAGKHVLVEKPMAANLDDAKAMVDAAATAGTVFLVGHSHSYDLPIQTMRALISGGTLGRVRMVNTWCYTDWIYRPRRPDELVTGLGGGVTYRQGAHQFDIIRLLCGGKVKSVKARTFDMDPARRAIGAHTVFIDFEDGAAATAVYNGYGGFSSMDLCFDVSEWGFAQPEGARNFARRPLANSNAVSAVDEQAAKRQRGKTAIPGSAPLQPFFGMTLVSCEKGDIRQSPHGLFVYSAEGKQEIKLPADRSPRDLVMAEFYDAITGRAPAIHDGRWGLANLAVCDAAIASSASGREEAALYQVAVHA